MMVYRSIRMAAVVCALLTEATAVLPAAGPDTLRITGLRQPVEIMVDRWGISHIYAGNEHDLFFAQGYAAAQDRLFQFELWRRQATGTVAEMLGRRELNRDIGTRLFMFRGDLKQEFQHYHPQGEAIITAFVEGVNAYIAQTERNPSLLPLEFRLLGIKPGRWTPGVVISRHQGLLANINQELSYALAVRAMGVERVKRLSYFQGGDPVLEMDPAIDASLLTPRILDLYNAFRVPVRFLPADVVAAYRGALPSDERASAAGAMPSLGELTEGQADVGSNNWVVSGKLTQSHYPMMANDPHRAQSAPSLRYYVHLVGPGWNVIGGGEPVLPGVSIGHNEYGAWGLTVFGNDSEDLYVYETNPVNPNQYRYRGGWEGMKVVRDTIPVKGEAPVIVDLKYTRHGPVLHENKEKRTAYALRAGWMEIGSAPYLASLRMDQVRNWEEFREACSYSRIPAENMVWADRAGNIGWQAVGIQPLRPIFSGLVPVPGDGRYEWDGYLPILALPHVVNPEKGFWGTANHYLMPRNYPYPAAMHYTWSEPYRASRIDEVLGSGRMFAVTDMMRLQQDEVSLPARALVPLLADLKTTEPVVARALELLRTWDFVLDKNSSAAGIYVAWENRLKENVRDLYVPEQARAVFGQLNMKKVIDLLVAADGDLGGDPIAGRDRLLLRSLGDVVADLTRKLGPDMSKWQYGQERYKHARMMHQLSDVLSASLREKLNVGVLPRGGNSYTVNNTGGSDNQLSGASFRIIADTEDWDNSVGTNTPGQSGDPDSPHYRDLFPLWAAGKYFPVFFSRAKVESVAERVTLLQPAAGAATGSASGAERGATR